MPVYLVEILYVYMMSRRDLCAFVYISSRFYKFCVYLVEICEFCVGFYTWRGGGTWQTARLMLRSLSLHKDQAFNYKTKH